MRRVVRIVQTTVMAMMLSGLAGGLVAQVLAVETDAREEFIIVFMMTVLLCLLTTLLFFVAQFFADQRKAANSVALVLLTLLVGVLLVAGGGVLFGQGNLDGWPLLLGLVLPGVAIVLAQWLIVRWRVRPPEPPAAMPRFGRGGVA